MEARHRMRLYFICWIFLALLCVFLNILNIDWDNTNIVIGALIVIILGVLQGSVLEFPLITIATFLVGGNTRENKRAPCDRLTIMLNYNLLATNKDDIDECLETMYMAYIGNLSANVSAVLVSATNDDELKKYELRQRDKYRDLIYDEVYREGLAFSQGKYNDVDNLHFKHIWKKHLGTDANIFVDKVLDNVCETYAREFMVVHRVSRVLKKCGQYQDLMLLSEGISRAFSYCDSSYYGKQARKKGENLFHESKDVSNILNRKFDYTLVLDGDTGVPRGGVFDLLEIAAGNPDKGIIQPSIKFQCTKDDTIYMHLEASRQAIYGAFTNAMTSLLGQSGFFGKALIKNNLYIEHVIGTEDNLIERVPVDVLSHDTFEAALLKPMYAGSTYLLEAPCYNYVTWSIRERRWNRGEVILASYFWENAVGKPMRWLQKHFQKSKFNKTKLRTKSHLDFVTTYIAHSALRHMLMKPFLLLYICITAGGYMKYPYISIIVVMFTILIFPKFAVCNRKIYKHVILETIASILQYTPEAVVGTIRLCRAVYANISLNAKWVPQRAVEEEFKKSNPFISSFRHLWGYSLFAIICCIVVMLFTENSVLIFPLLLTLLFLPLFTGFTSLKAGSIWSKTKKVKHNDNYSSRLSTHHKGTSHTVNLGIQSLSSGKMYQSLGQLWNGHEYSDTSYLLSSANDKIDSLIDNTYNFGKNKFKNLISPSRVPSNQFNSGSSLRKYMKNKPENEFHDDTNKILSTHSVFKMGLNGKTQLLDYYDRSGNKNDVERLLQRLHVLNDWQFSDRNYLYSPL